METCYWVCPPPTPRAESGTTQELAWALFFSHACSAPDSGPEAGLIDRRPWALASTTPFRFPLPSVVPRPPLWVGSWGQPEQASPGHGAEGTLSCPHGCVLFGFSGALRVLRFNVSEVRGVPQPVAPGKSRQLKLKSGSCAGAVGLYQPPGALLFSACGSRSGETAPCLHPCQDQKGHFLCGHSALTCFPSGALFAWGYRQE